jgi:fibronectin-binding autotransporter adhesin
MGQAWRRPWRALSVGALAVSGIAAGGGLVIGSAVVASSPASATPPACTDSWKTATSGNWDTATNWSTGVVPGSSDTACITVPGTYTVTYQPSSGSETVDSLVLGSGTNGDQETLSVQGTCSDNVTLTTKNTATGTDTDLINSTGNLFLTSASCGNASTLAIGSTLVNDGSISTTSGAGNNGRTITGSLTNDGTVTIGANTSYSTGTWDNTGALNLADSITLTVASTAPSTFTDGTGGSVTSNGTGQTGQLVVDSGDTYNQGNGTTSGEPVLLAGPPTGTGIALHYTGNGASTVLAEGGTGTLDGAIAIGQTLSIDGTCSNDATETVDATETNAGTVHLSSTSCGNAATLVVTSGDTFTNTGTVDLDQGAGNNGRTITGNLTNDGTVNVNANTSDSTGTWDNTGALDLADSTSLTVTSTAPSTFTDGTGGSVTSNGTNQTGQLVIDGANTYNQGNGTTSGEPVLLAGPPTGTGIALHYTGTGVSTIVAEGGTGTLDGAIASGQTLSIDGTCSNNALETVDANETNTGTVHLSSISCGNASTLAVASGKTFTNEAAGIVDVDQGVGNNGRTVTGNLTNKGKVNVNAAGTYSGGTWTNSGKLTIASGVTWNSPASAGVTFTNTTGGSVVALGTGPALELGASDTFNQGDGKTTGTEPVLLAGPASGTGAALHYTGTGVSTITTFGTGTVDGTMSAGQVLDIDGTCSNNADEVIDQPMTTTGTIDLSSISCGNAATLAGKNAMGTDKLTIGVGGVLQTDNGVGNGGRTIDDDVVSKGTFNVNVATTYTAEHNGFTKKKGTLNIASGVTLTASAVAGSVFSNKKGAIAGTGELVVESPDTFAEGLGTITGATVLVNGGTLDYLTEVVPKVPGAGTIETEGTSTLVGAPSAGQTVEVLGTCSLNATLTASSSFTDNGGIVISSTTCGNNSTLVLPAGDALTVGHTGSLSWPSGAGGAKAVTGSIVNDGTIGNSGEVGLSVSGTLTLGSSGTFAPSENGNSSDSISAAGGGTLGGTLAPSGTITSGQTDTILNGAFTGSFSATNGWTIAVNPTTVTMHHA